MMITKRSVLALAAFGGLALAACSSSMTSAAPAGGGGTHAVVAVRSVPGVGKVLTAGDGHTLYMAKQEKSGKLFCTNGCTSIWMPLTVAKAQHLSAPSGVTGNLSTVTRPDGSKQVTLNRSPLYTFALDQSAGQTKGNGVNDNFNGVNFNWHAATASGAAATAPSGSSGNGGGYGYGY
jgi:predicted lipoprotein with Yx(FWY)xxD motif